MLKGSPLRRTLALILVGTALGMASGAAAHADQQCAVRSDGSSICLGDRVIDYRNQTGSIQEIYSDYSAVIRFDDGNEYVLDIQYLSREVPSLYGYNQGDRVIDGSGNYGYLEDI